MKEKTKKLTETKTKNLSKAKKANLTDLEKRAIEKLKKRTEERITALKYKKTSHKQVTPVEEEPLRFFPQLLETTGSFDPDFSGKIISQASSVLQEEDDEVAANFTAALMHGLRPQDETEGILVAQMAGTHNLIMQCMQRAVQPGQFPAITNDYTLRACKLMHVFLKQLEVLEKYRGKTSRQKVIVEHVHIHQGGQAVVGHIDNRKQGEGDETKK